MRNNPKLGSFWRGCLHRQRMGKKKLSPFWGVDDWWKNGKSNDGVRRTLHLVSETSWQTSSVFSVHSCKMTYYVYVYHSSSTGSFSLLAVFQWPSLCGIKLMSNAITLTKIGPQPILTHNQKSPPWQRLSHRSPPPPPPTAPARRWRHRRRIPPNQD